MDDPAVSLVANFLKIFESEHARFVLNVKEKVIPPRRYEYVGRGSPYGNPYTHLPLHLTKASVKVDTRDESILFYAVDLVSMVRQNPEKLVKLRRHLAGKFLGCYCYPEHCHAHVLALLANTTMTMPEFVSNYLVGRSPVQVNANDQHLPRLLDETDLNVVKPSV